jgi:hypothetical protein
MIIFGSISHLPKAFEAIPHQLSTMKLEDCVGTIRLSKNTKPEIVKKLMKLEPHSMKIDRNWSVTGRKK